MMEDETANMTTGDQLTLSYGDSKRVWVISAVNNRVVKYFDENGRYGQMPVEHLAEMVRSRQAVIGKKSP
jgi:hypothetical protein